MKFNCPKCNHKLEVSLSKLHYIYSLIIALLTIVLVIILLLPRSHTAATINTNTNNSEWPSAKQVFKGFNYDSFTSGFVCSIDRGVTATYETRSNCIKLTIDMKNYHGNTGLDRFFDNIFPGCKDPRIKFIGRPRLELDKKIGTIVSHTPIKYKNFSTTLEIDRRNGLNYLYITPTYSNNKE